MGSTNPAKVAAVEGALRELAAGTAAGLSLLGVDVASGVPEQPIGLEEIMAGARERARAARASGPCSLAVGIEDGLVRLDALGRSSGSSSGVDDLAHNIGCAWVFDGEREGHGLSAGFLYPPGCRLPALRDRAPIGGLFDALWRRHRDPQAKAESGRREGNIGKLTGGRLGRSAYAGQAVLCALIPFLHVDLYD